MTHHLAAVAHAERKAVAAAEELDEHLGELRPVKDGLGPAAAGTQHVTVGKSAAGDETLELG